MLGRADLLGVLLPGLAGGDKHHFIQVERRRHFTGCDKVAVVDRVKGATHDAQPPTG